MGGGASTSKQAASVEKFRNDAEWYCNGDKKKSDEEIKNYLSQQTPSYFHTGGNGRTSGKSNDIRPAASSKGRTSTKNDRMSPRPYDRNKTVDVFEDSTFHKSWLSEAE